MPGPKKQQKFSLVRAKWTLCEFYKQFNRYKNVLTSLSPSRSTPQWRKPVCPTLTVMLRCTLKSKYGCWLSLVVILLLFIVVVRKFSFVIWLLWWPSFAVCESLKLSVSRFLYREGKKSTKRDWIKYKNNNNKIQLKFLSIVGYCRILYFHFVVITAMNWW